MSEREDLIFEIAKRSELISNFNDIRVVDESEDTIAYTDSRTKTLYINENMVKEDEVNPLITHEFGHIDRRLKSPKGLEDFYVGCIKKNPNLKDVLNFVFDMNIHIKFERLVPFSFKIQLDAYLTELRNKCYQLDKDSLILSLVYPKMFLQLSVKDILLNTKLSDLQKADLILRLIKKENNSGKGKGKNKKDNSQDSDSLGNSGKSGNKGESGKRKLSDKEFKDLIKRLCDTKTKCILDKDEVKSKKRNSESIKESIQLSAKQLKELRDKLKELGYSSQQIEMAISEMKSNQIDYFIKNLDSLKDILKLSEKAYVKQKELKKKRIKDWGKLIGYRRIKDVSDLMKNPIDTILLANYDLNSIRIPKFLDDKHKTTNVFIIRDVSGSLSSYPINDVVRDVVVSVIGLAKRNKYKCGVIEFHSTSNILKSRDNLEISRDYDTLILKSLANKMGYSTCLSLAIKDLNRIIKKFKLEGEDNNVIVITDRYTDLGEKIEVKEDKLKLIILSTEKNWRDVGEFDKWLSLHKNVKQFYLNQLTDSKSKQLVLDEITEKEK